MENEKETPEQKAKRQRLKNKMNEVMAEVAEEMMDQETLDKVEENLKEVFTSNGLTFSYQAMNAFLHGMEFTMASMGKDHNMTMMILIALRSMVEKRKVEIKKATPNI